jgi:hypothetical protein
MSWIHHDFEKCAAEWIMSPSAENTAGPGDVQSLAKLLKGVYALGKADAAKDLRALCSGEEMAAREVAVENLPSVHTGRPR